MQGNPIDPSDMKFYHAARYNPVLSEVQIAVQHEGMPSAFQENPDSYLRLFGEHGMDEENDAEARAYLDHWTQRLLERDIKELSSCSSRLVQNSNSPLSSAWEDALDEFGRADAAEVFESYKALVENTFNVAFINTNGADEWNLANIRTAHVGLEQVARALGDQVRDISGFAADDATVFRQDFGGITLNRSTEASEAVAEVAGHTITIFWKQNDARNYNLLPNLLLHE